MGKLEKIPAWQLKKVRRKKDVIDEARKEGKTLHFASLMDICHLKNSELEPKFRKHKGRVVVRGDTVKYYLGSYAVFTEQGSCASQMTAVKVMDIISRLPGCAGQAADAVSAYTQGKNGRCINVFKKCRFRMSRHFGYVYHNTNGQNHGPAWKTQFVPLGRNLYGHSLTSLLWERHFEKVLFEHGWEKVPNWGCLLVNREKRTILVCVCPNV